MPPVNVPAVGEGGGVSRVMVCEIDGDGGALDTQWARLVRHADRYRPELVVLPEMPFGPWLPASPQVDPAAWDESAKTHEIWLERLGELGAGTVVGSRPVVDDGRRYNEAFVWVAGVGTTATHRKTFLPDEPGFFEASWYERGPTRFDPAASPAGTVGLLVCTEVWFSEHARDHGRRGAELLAVPRATPAGSNDRWEAAVRVAAITAGAYAVSANRAGASGSVSFGGGSWIVDPEGTVLGRTTATAPAITLDVDLAVVATARTTYPRYVDTSPR